MQFLICTPVKFLNKKCKYAHTLKCKSTYCVAYELIEARLKHFVSIAQQNLDFVEGIAFVFDTKKVLF